MSRIVEVLPACCPRMLIVILPLCPWCDISTEIATANYAWSVPKYSKVKFKQTRRLGAIRKLSRLELPRLFSERRNRSPLPSPEGLPVAKSFSLDTRWQALKALVRGKNLGCGSRRLCENWAPQKMGLLFSLVKVQSLWVAGASFLQPHACWSHGVRSSWNRYDRCAEFWKQRNSKDLKSIAETVLLGSGCLWCLRAWILLFISFLKVSLVLCTALWLYGMLAVSFSSALRNWIAVWTKSMNKEMAPSTQHNITAMMHFEITYALHR